MFPEPLPSTSDLSPDPRAIRRKVGRRIVPLIFVAYIIAYLDRANAGFAKLQMQERLSFPDDVFGWGFGIFFAGYLLLEIPGALLVEHWSARKGFARILLTWSTHAAWRASGSRVSRRTARASGSGTAWRDRYSLGSSWRPA